MSLVPLLGGCDKFLDQVPDDRAEINDVESVKALLVSAYPDVHYVMQGELMSDNADDKGSWGISLYPQMQEEAYYWEESTQNVQDAPELYWGRLYKAISAANHAIEAIEGMGSTAEFAPYLGEAKMARAFTHFLLVNFWAEHYDSATAATDLGVPYVTTPEKQALVDYHRSTVAEVYDLIEKDITEALPLLSDNAYDVPKYHFTKAAANAFMARFYLFRGEEGDWDKVIAHTTAVLGEGTNYRSQLRDYAGKYVPISSNGDAYSQLYTDYGEASILLLINGSSLWPWNYRQGRYGMSEAKITEVFNSNAMVKDNRWIGMVYTQVWPHYNLGKFFRYLKVDHPGALSGTPYALCPVLTVEEVVFNRAEAYVMKKNYTAAVDDLNVWLSTRTKNYNPALHTVTAAEIVEYYRNRPEAIKLYPWYADRMDDEQMCMLQYITDLRRKEFLQEGMRWFDVKRFGIEVTHRVFESSEKGVLTRFDPRRVWQIPSVAQDYGIEPNPR
jgi:tetratricopeptide (TPR) repeat protein